MKYALHMGFVIFCVRFFTISSVSLIFPTLKSGLLLRELSRHGLLSEGFACDGFPHLFKLVSFLLRSALVFLRLSVVDSSLLVVFYFWDCYKWDLFARALRLRWVHCL